MQEFPDSVSDIPNTNQDDPECVCCNVNAQTEDNSSGSDSSENDSEESNSSHKVIVDSRSSTSDTEGGREEDSIIQPLSEQESHVQVRSILSCLLRYNMSASECKDVLKTMKDLFPGSEADHVLDYDRIWRTRKSASSSRLLETAFEQANDFKTEPTTSLTRTRVLFRTSDCGKIWQRACASANKCRRNMKSQDPTYPASGDEELGNRHLTTGFGAPWLDMHCN